jgi:predicted nucleic acid-binding protein
MILVDTSIWVNHLRRGDRELTAVLETGEVACHDFVIGELACGRLSARAEILNLLGALPRAPVVEHEEVIAFVERYGLAGVGIGWIDAHLLASARLERLELWTRDAQLRRAALRIGVPQPAR